MTEVEYGTDTFFVIEASKINEADSIIGQICYIVN